MIKVRGARQHNLKNVDVDIPKNQFVVVTGVSGSGKSSFAFDTVYAEGQRRYVESLSAYARQFLGIMDKPDVDLIEGLSPSISIDQKTVSHNPRSTVGTITEIYDYLRVLFARIGHPHCPNDGTEITRLSVDQIVDKVIDEIKKVCISYKVAPHEFTILSPIVRQKKGEFLDLLENLQSKGFQKVIVDGLPKDLVDDIPLLKANKHSISVIIDTLFASHKDIKEAYFIDTLRPRLTQAIEQATKLSGGLAVLQYHDTLAQQTEVEEVKKGSKKKLSPTLKEHLYSEKFSCATCGFSLPEIEPRMFSFNSPLGACDSCRGLGNVNKVDPDLIFAPKLSINEGGILPFTKLFYSETWYTRLIKTVCDVEKIDLNKSIEKLTDEQRNVILHGTGKVYRVNGTNRFGKDTMIQEKFDGIVSELERRFYGSTGTADDGSGHDIGRYMREELCKSCKGKKLKPEVLAITIDAFSIADICDLAVLDIIEFSKSGIHQILNTYEEQIAAPILNEIITRLQFLQNVGLGYLTMSRKGKTLSGGELQRIRLASQIGTGLTGVLYVLDEPSIGLHPRDVAALIKTLHHLKEIGNTLIIVEHDEETIQSAEYMIEFGPEAGKQGGEVVAIGTIAEIKNNPKSLTGQYLSGARKITSKEMKFEKNKGEIILKKASEYSLKNVTLNLPVNNLIAITGVSGSGKSTLITETLYPAMKYHLDGHYTGFQGAYEKLEGFHYVDRVYLVDQSPIGRTPRSNPATYIGFFDDIRDLFASTVDAKARGYEKGRFSFNVKGGRCEKCQGAGVVKIEMQFLSDVYITCDVCEGHRYNRETLEVRYKNKTIYEVLKMTIDEAAIFFENFVNIHPKLKFLQEVGLGYIELGQAAPTFSGGEAQRIKLADELSRGEKGRTLYILDEPTTGLHFADVQKLMNALVRLVEHGNTVVVIEHNLDVIKHCQYIVDLGPEGGDGGGQILYQGELEGIKKVKNSYTGAYLK
ncbi:MAG: excinuclease ABC subunit UvrA [Candidatus Roizmanbacteria bacterium]